MNRDPEHRLDKLALFVLAGLVVVVLGMVVGGVFWAKTVPDKGDVLLGGITTGLILFLRDLVQAVRTSWEEVSRGKIAEQLAGSSPANDNKTPRDAAEAADQVAEAAVDQADQIQRKAAT